MALREIKFQVDEGGVLSPSEIQIGGVQGEHKATVLVFKFSDKLYERLKGESKNGTLVYRFEAVDGANVTHTSIPMLLGEQIVTYPLEYAVTQHGGLVKVYLIISSIRIKEDEEESVVVYKTNDAAEIKLAFSSYTGKKYTEEYNDISILAQKAKQVLKALEELKSVKSEIEDFLKSDGEFVFQGGNASGEVSADFVIDDEIDESSCNAVQNKVVAKRIAKAEAAFAERLAIYNPVGGVFIAGEGIDPAKLFGGSWEKLKVTRSIGGKFETKFEEADKATAFPVNVEDFCILTNEDHEGFHITVTPLSSRPQSCSVCVGDILTYSEEDGKELITYLAGFNVYAHRPTTTPFTVYWHVTGESYTDNNGNYHWIRTA